jgi:hypothetical protein
MKDQRTKVKLWYSPKTPLHGGPKRKPKKKKRELPPPQTKQKKKKNRGRKGVGF